MEGVVKPAPTLPTLEVVNDEDYPDCPFDEENQTQESVDFSENKQEKVEQKV